MSDDLIDRLRSPEEIVLPTGTRIILDNGKKMGRYWLELLEPFSVWVSSSLKMDAAAEIVQLRAEIASYQACLQNIVNNDEWWNGPSIARDLLRDLVKGKEL